MSPDPAGDLPSYEVRLTEPAEMEVEAAYFGRLQFGVQAAERWYAGLARAMESLAVFPRGFVLAPESEALGGDVRQLVYGKGRSAYRILYRVIDPSGQEPGIVRILHIRHASQKRLDEEDE
jgi:plasmid stabilization system protein ParE